MAPPTTMIPTSPQGSSRRGGHAPSPEHSEHPPSSPYSVSGCAHGQETAREDGREPEFDATAEFAKLMSMCSGRFYISPARLRAMPAEAAKHKHAAPVLFQENFIRGRGLFARSGMKVQQVD
ncbi:hypothetical protein LXA43DRAFT_456545 [Ganoderma leucocontextum]|nr:hypothetical protein LXA43DRAFT_456545 [Ganoderma leucocontextum]